jgi:hypothetical protein
MKDGIQVMYQVADDWKVAVYGPFKPNQLNTITGNTIKEWVRELNPGKKVKIEKWGKCEMKLPPGYEIEVPSV